MWEAVHNLDALLKNRTEIQPDTLHADTQGQSEPVFGLCRLLGSRLMPRMRSLSDAVLYPMLLRTLGTYSRRNLLYRAFRELGRVERTCSCCASCPVSRSGALSVPKLPKSSRSTNSLVGSPSAARS